MAHVLLKDIIDIVMEYSEDPDNYLNGVSRALVISRAKRLLQEVNYAGLKNLSLFETEISASGKVVFPDDYVEYVKVYYCIGNYLMPAFVNDHINTLQWESLKESEEMFITSATGKKILTESNDYITVDVKVDEKVKDYGHVKNMCFLKGYKLDRKNNCIVFDYIPCGITHVAVLYVSDPLVGEPDISKLGIHKYFQKALEAGIYSYIIEQRRNVPMNEKIRAKREWLIKYKDAVNELNAKPYELLQALMGWKHMRPQCYPGMGGQSIPQKKEEKYMYSLEYVDFVCQVVRDEKEKEIDNITFSAQSSTTEVEIHIEAEKSVQSDVKLKFVPVVRNARNAQLQDVYYVLKKGETSGSFVAAMDLHGKNADASILSVANVVNSNEDDTYIYQVESDVFVPDLKEKNIVFINVSTTIENRILKITCNGDVTSKVVLELKSSTEPSYTKMVVLLPSIKNVTETLRSEFAGNDASIKIYSVDGKVGETSDDYSVYEVPESIAIPDIPKETVNIITVESELTIWRAKWIARSQYPVASEISISLSLSSNDSMIPNVLKIPKGETEPREYGGFYVPMIGADCAVSLDKSEDDTYKYEVENLVHHFADPNFLEANDWNVSFEVEDNGRIYPVINFERPLTSDVEFCFSTKADDYRSAIMLVDMKAGETVGRPPHASMNSFVGEDVKFFVFSVAGKSEPSATIQQAWDLEQVFQHIKMVRIPTLCAKLITNGESLNLTVSGDDKFLISWGDGNVEYSMGSFSHTYSDEVRLHNIHIFALGDFTSIGCAGCKLTSLEAHNPRSIYCRDNSELFSLNIINGGNIQELNCEACNIQNLDVVDFGELRNLYCTDNPLTQLDVSQNSELLDLACGKTQITSLDVSNCINIQKVSLYANPPLALDQSALTAFANTLPDRTGKDAGILSINNDTSAEWIQEICTAKNWTIE